MQKRSPDQVLLRNALATGPVEDGHALSRDTARVHRKVVNALTVDVEDYFQVEAFKNVVRYSEWDEWPTRVEQNTDRILQMMSDVDVRGTFFTLGWVAKRFPDLVKRISAAGHEVASHGTDHGRADQQTPDDFYTDVLAAKHLLEDLSGSKIRGYRAPTFSIGRKNWWAYDMLAKAGYDYSSSLYPVTHDLYGTPDAPRTPFRPMDGPLLEIPMTTVRLMERNLPCSGGGYFRLLPYTYSRWGLRRANREHMAGVFYCHPWEFDAGQPRIPGANAKARLRHYTNIGIMPRRFSRLLRDFCWDRMDRVFLGQPASD